MHRYTYTSGDTPTGIPDNRVATISSAIDVDVNEAIRHVTVAIDLRHTWTEDLRITLQSPDGTRVVLVADEGGSQDNFLFTIFDDRSTSSIEGARAPFRGTFAPEGNLAAFNGTDPNGPWSLEIHDSFPADGGVLNAWFLALTTEEVDEPASEFQINVNFLGGLSASQQQVFSAAAERWHEIIVGDPTGLLPGADVATLDIDASGVPIDGLGVGGRNTLGRAGPTRFRYRSGLPSRGIMEFDMADLAAMELDGSLLDVIIHEMGHVIGIGTVWSRLGLLSGAGTTNPEFHGVGAMAEYASLISGGGNEPVPVANRGGPGTADSHWRESVFGGELMTGTLNTGVNPLSRLTIAALADMGYAVNFATADDFVLPSSLMLAAMGIGGETMRRRDRCCIATPDVD